MSLSKRESTHGSDAVSGTRTYAPASVTRTQGPLTASEPSEPVCSWRSRSGVRCTRLVDLDRTCRGHVPQCLVEGCRRKICSIGGAWAVGMMFCEVHYPLQDELRSIL